MNFAVWLFLFLFLAPVWSLPQEEPQPSLVEVARRERERRAALPEPALIITNANLREVRGRVSTAGKSAPAPPPEGPGETETGDSDNWQSLFEEARLNLKLAEDRGRVLQLKMTDLHNSWLSSSDGTTQARRRQQLQENQQKVEANQKEIQAAREALQRIQREGKAKGASPGEMRRLEGSSSPD